MDNNVELSVVLPCLNEEEAIGICIDKIKDVFAKAKLNAEIVVADNGSTDRSRQIAESKGARVVVEPVRGYGAAYQRGLNEAKGKYIVMADSDNTYDFYAIPKFLEALRSGYDLIMGSRFKGKIQKGAMSWSHRYIGNPILSSMTRLFFRTRLSDIHCGMRAFSRKAYDLMNLQTLGMEFATEMVFSALLNNLRIYEIPIDYYPRKGESKLRDLYDAWRHIRFMLLYCPLWLYFIPGILGSCIGISILLFLLKGPFLFLGRYWDIHIMVFGSLLCIFSYQVINIGVYAHTYGIREQFLKYDPLTLFFQRIFTLERGLVLGLALFLTGFAIMLFIFVEWFSKDFGALYRIRESILAMTLLIIGLQTMFSSFFISFLYIRRKQVR